MQLLLLWLDDNKAASTPGDNKESDDRIFTWCSLYDWNAA
jgi:hypothetical protein